MTRLSFRATKHIRRAALTHGLGSFVLAFLVVGCADRALAPLMENGAASRDVSVTDSSSTVILQRPLYQGSVLSDCGPTNGNAFYYLLVSEDGSTSIGDNLCFSAPPTRAGVPAGDYMLQLGYSDGTQWRTIPLGVRTLQPASTLTVPGAELSTVLGRLAVAVTVNGHAPADFQYRVCIQGLEGCAYVRQGAFAAYVLPGPGSAVVRNSSDVIVGSFTFDGAVGVTATSVRTTDGVDVGELAVTDPTSTVVLQRPLYQGVVLSDCGPTNAGAIYYLFVRSDGTTSTGDNLCFTNPLTRAGLVAGDYVLQLGFSDGSAWRTIVLGTKTLEPASTLTVPGAELSGVLGRLALTVKVDGRTPADFQYRVCIQGFESCADVRQGVFAAFVLPGSGSGVVRNSTGLVVGRFTFHGIAGQTVTSVRTADGQDVSEFAASDPAGTVVLQRPLYHGAVLPDCEPTNANSFYYLLVGADGSTSVGDNLCFRNALTRTGVPPGDYVLQLGYADEYQWRTIALGTTTVVPGSTLSVSGAELSSALGQLEGALRVNGQIPPDFQYRICVQGLEVCSYVRQGTFRAYVLPGSGTFTVRNSAGTALGTFTFIAAAGQTVTAGSISGGTPGATPSGSGVTVQPVNNSTSSSNTSLSLTFSNVEGGGTTTVTQQSSGNPVPDGLRVGSPPIYYDINTTATFTGPIEVCINYTGTTFQNQTNLKLLHGNGNGTWTDVTTSIDRTNRIICGLVTSLSPFVVVEAPPNTAPAISSTNGPVSATEGGTATLSVSATDPDGDPLSYTWDVDANGTVDRVTSAGSTQLQAGAPRQFSVRVTVTDGKGGSATALITVTVSNVAPILGPLAAPTAPVALQAGGIAIPIAAPLSDPGSTDIFVARANCGGGVASSERASTNGSIGSAAATCTFAAAGVYNVSLTVTDRDGASMSTAPALVVVYDPTAGFVTGGGWINSVAGALAANPSLAGKATFGFVAKYEKGANAPTGSTEFQFQTASFRFVSTTYQWLVVSGPMAQVKGSGSVNGASGYDFILTATDGDLAGGGGSDRFRMRIVGPNGVVYDNTPAGGSSPQDSNPQAIGGGSITIHSR